VEAAPSTFTDYLGVVRRRWWIAVLAFAVSIGAALLVSRVEKPTYQATAEVRLAAQPLATIISGQHLTSAEAARYAATQAQQADTPSVAAAALKRAHISGLTPAQLLKRTNVQASPTSDFLTFTIADRHPDTAKRLATVYAQAYAATANSQVIRQIDMETSKFQSQADAVKAKLAQTTGYSPSLQAQYRQLLGILTQLQIARAGQAGSTLVAETAQSAPKVSPKVSRNLLIGAGIGLILGLALMSLVEALDRRVRDSAEIEQRLGLPLLGRVPTPPRSTRKTGHLGLLEVGADRTVDIFDRLRVSVDFANVKARATTIMVTSAVEREGKSTTAGNLALALAGAGRRVALVDLDLRRPMLATFFELPDRIGATTRLLGDVSIDEALQPVPLPPALQSPKMGSLYVMTSGPLPPIPSPLLESEATRELLDEIAERVDVVIVDSAPLLPVSDSVILGSKVDAVMVMVRSEVVTRPILSELHRTLVELPTPKLGFVLTGAEHDASGYGYGYGYGYEYRGPRDEASSTQDDTDREPDSARLSKLSSGEPNFDQS
jgi:capsular exopolysaccharide synthesis family protein